LEFDLPKTKPNKMKHLVLRIENGWITYHMEGQTGMHPLGDDTPEMVIAYLIRIINPSSHEVMA